MIGITHRLSTVESVDRTLMTDRGRVVVQGTHHSPSENNLLNRTLFKSGADGKIRDARGDIETAAERTLLDRRTGTRAKGMQQRKGRSASPLLLAKYLLGGNDLDTPVSKLRHPHETRGNAPSPMVVRGRAHDRLPLATDPSTPTSRRADLRASARHAASCPSM